MNIEHTKNDTREHAVSLKKRKTIQIDGVEEVVCFDEQAVTLHTVCGTLSIEGGDLHIHTLNLEAGIVSLDGKIDALIYTDQEQNATGGKTGFLKRLLR